MSSHMRAVDDALQLISAAGAAACGIDRRHRVVYWNEGASDLMGWSADEALGKACHDVFAGRDLYGNLCCFRGCAVSVALERGESPTPFVMDVVRRDGTPLRLITRTTAVPSPGEDYRCLVHLFESAEGQDLEGLVARIRSAVSRSPRSEEKNGGARAADGPSLRLTRRELEVVRLLASGYGSINIAARLGLSHATVRNHIQKLLRRLEVHSQVEAVSVAFRRGLIGGEESGGDGRIRTDE